MVCIAHCNPFWLKLGRRRVLSRVFSYPARPPPITKKNWGGIGLLCWRSTVPNHSEYADIRDQGPRNTRNGVMAECGGNGG